MFGFQTCLDFRHLYLQSQKVLTFVFQLRLPNSSCSEDVHVMFRQWMESLGCQVHDLENPDQDEDINSDPEGWVQQVLSNNKVKVVVIEGSGDSIEAKDLETRCLLGQTSGPPSTCTAISTSTATSSITGSSASSEDGRFVKADTL